MPARFHFCYRIHMPRRARRRPRRRGRYFRFGSCLDFSRHVAQAAHEKQRLARSQKADFDMFQEDYFIFPCLRDTSGATRARLARCTSFAQAASPSTFNSEHSVFWGRAQALYDIRRAHDVGIAFRFKAYRTPYRDSMEIRGIRPFAFGRGHYLIF